MWVAPRENIEIDILVPQKSNIFEGFLYTKIQNF